MTRLARALAIAMVVGACAPSGAPADETGSLAVGTAITGRPSDAMAPAAWRSPDGRGWDRLVAPGLTWDAATAAPGDGLTSVALASEVLATPPGVLALGAGMTQRADEDGAQPASPWRYLAWTSTAGDTWTRVPDDPALVVGTVNTYVLGPSAAVVHGGRLLLFGTRWPTSSADQVDVTGLPTIWETAASTLGIGT